jgi:predicted DNA-binding transcriptional regulator AlpA
MEQWKVPLEHTVYSEVVMLEVLGVDKGTLDDLRRERGFPFVRLTARARVYLADEVLDWLKQHTRR